VIEAQGLIGGAGAARQNQLLIQIDRDCTEDVVKVALRGLRDDELRAPLHRANAIVVHVCQALEVAQIVGLPEQLDEPVIELA